ncbi:hypothetical protein N0V90_006800 [Kalmusia sp. IMI 367209]|nr:hypothetical protein N0V90_006800 [Kalmusia sp. IMI 367209]
MGCGSSKQEYDPNAYRPAPQQVGAGNPAYDAYAAEQYNKMKKEKKKKKLNGVGGALGVGASICPFGAIPRKS